MKFKNEGEFEKLHDRICIGQIYGGQTFFGRKYLFCKLCNSYYRSGFRADHGHGQLDSRMVKARLERIDEDLVDCFREKVRKNFEKMGIEVKEEPKA